MGVLYFDYQTALGRRFDPLLIGTRSRKREPSPGNWREHDIEPFPGGMKRPSFTEVGISMRGWVGLSRCPV